MGNIGLVQVRYEVLPTAVLPAQAVPAPRPGKLGLRLVRLIRRADAKV